MEWQACLVRGTCYWFRNHFPINNYNMTYFGRRLSNEIRKNKALTCKKMLENLTIIIGKFQYHFVYKRLLFCLNVLFIFSCGVAYFQDVLVYRDDEECDDEECEEGGGGGFHDALVVAVVVDDVVVVVGSNCAMMISETDAHLLLVGWRGGVILSSHSWDLCDPIIPEVVQQSPTKTKATLCDHG